MDTMAYTLAIAALVFALVATTNVNQLQKKVKELEKKINEL